MEIRHGKFKLSQNFSSTSREFMDSKIFNTLTCNKICTPLNFFALRPIKTRKTYHRKITKVLKQQKEQVSARKTSRENEINEQEIEFVNFNFDTQKGKSLKKILSSRTQIFKKMEEKKRASHIIVSQPIYPKRKKKRFINRKVTVSRDQKLEVSPWPVQHFKDSSSIYMNDSAI